MTVENIEPSHESDLMRYRRLFPWLHLLRIPGITLNTQILLVGFIASYMLMTIDLLTLGNSDSLHLTTLTDLVHSIDGLLIDAASPNTTLYLLTSIVTGMKQSSYLMNPILIMIVHIISGLIICRLAGPLFTTGKGVCLENTVVFAIRKSPDFLLSLVFPLVILSVLAGISYAGLAIEFVPAVGPWLAGVSYGPCMLLLFFMYLLGIGLIVGWPMIVAALTIENEDGFNAWSRSFDYMRSRLFVIVPAMIVCLLIGLLIQAFLGQIMQWSWNWLDQTIVSIEGVSLEEVTARDRATFEDGSAGFQNLWKTLASCVISGFIRSYYWVSVIAIYVIIRQSVDRTPVTEFERS